ncbi:hypothetical protein [Cryobacterium sp. M96]|uniref:hypothetical protein n=1 Tax=Cryobacterium sp. M96 TaxID=2048295 RepID=UPI0013048726|nr:hypothetical protein [Cryobacterium sp. M96]
MASTLITPDSGSVHMGEIDATLLSLAEKAQLRWDRLGIVFQQSNLMPDAVGLLGQAGKRPARLTVEHDTATVLVTHDQRLLPLPLVDFLHTMVDGTRTTSRHSISA